MTCEFIHKKSNDDSGLGTGNHTKIHSNSSTTRIGTKILPSPTQSPLQRYTSIHEIDHCIPLLIARMLAPNSNHHHMRLLSKYWQCPRIHVGFHRNGCCLFFATWTERMNLSLLYWSDKFKRHMTFMYRHARSSHLRSQAGTVQNTVS